MSCHSNLRQVVTLNAFRHPTARLPNHYSRQPLLKILGAMQGRCARTVVLPRRGALVPHPAHGAAGARKHPAVVASAAPSMDAPMKAPAPAPKLWLLHWSSAKAHGPAGGEALLAPEYVENLTCEVKMLEKVLKDSLWSKTHVAGDRTVHVLAATGKAKHAEKYGLAELDTSAGASSSSYALPDGTSVALPLGEMLSVLAMGQDKKRMKEERKAAEKAMKMEKMEKEKAMMKGGMQEEEDSDSDSDSGSESEGDD